MWRRATEKRKRGGRAEYGDGRAPLPEEGPTSTVTGAGAGAGDDVFVVSGDNQNIARMVG